MSATRSEWRAVNGDLASMTRGERLGDPVEPVVVGDEQEVGRLPARDVRDVERGPEAVLDREQRVDDRGREPAAAALARDRARGLPPPAAWKISAVWARQRMRASGGISSPRSPSGMPRPSQCSSRLRIAAAVPSER